MKEDKLYLLHIQESILHIKTYVIDGKQQFVNSTLIQDAVLRNLQTLSESTQRLSDELKIVIQIYLGENCGRSETLLPITTLGLIWIEFGKLLIKIYPF